MRLRARVGIFAVILILADVEASETDADIQPLNVEERELTTFAATTTGTTTRVTEPATTLHEGFTDAPEHLTTLHELSNSDLDVTGFKEPSDIVTQSIVATQDTLEDLNHECLRDCSHSPSKICYYKFKVEWYITMSKGCYNCPHNLTDCLRPHCAFADGHERPIVTVNRRFPGPKIQVCVNDEIVVDVENDLGSDSTSIHWHGLHQRGTPYMDGVPFLTQCPIPPYTTFRYHFVADLPGTHYWHSHSGFQRTDGMFGALIVRSSKESDPLSEHYDEDDPNHVFMLTDWLEKLGIDKFVNHHHTEHDNKPYNILVNGIGKYKPLINSKGEKAFTPVQEIAVKKGRRYRMRAISNSIQNCPIVISVNNHTILAIATDGSPIEPIRVKSLTIYGGERWDFVVETSQAVGMYWINFQGMLDCDERFKSAHQVAVLKYDGAEDFPTPLEDVSYETTIPNGLQLNKLNAAPGDGVTFITAAEMKSTFHDDADYIKGAPDHTFWLDFDFYSKDSSFHHPKYYPFFGVEEKKRLFMPQINDISFKYPNVPPLSQPADLDTTNFCNQTSSASCSNKFCACPYVINLEKGALVELILVDRGVVYWANHPFHLHGHSFRVLAMGRLGEETTLKKIQEMDRRGEIERNFNHPPRKDTVTVPDGGYTVIRFIADNPGYWLFHCHISFHVEVGMGLIFHVGEQHHLPKVPDNFPQCGPWEPEVDTQLKQKLRLWESNLDKNINPVDINLIPDGDNSLSGTHYEISNNAHHTQSDPEKAHKNSQGIVNNSVILNISSIVLLWILIAVGP
ncbi:unnamed protein product, partial [Meganyctiphanes norvegica]